jgi:hypothetical protein
VDVPESGSLSDEQQRAVISQAEKYGVLRYSIHCDSALADCSIVHSGFKLRFYAAGEQGSENIVYV